MAQTDTLAYSNAMAAMRGQRNADLYPDVRPWIRGYYDCARLPLGPLVVDVDPTVQDRVVFPRKFFQSSQAYVREALAQKPPKSASAEARVFWMLDVWSTMVEGLLALNVDLVNPKHPRNGLGYMPLTGAHAIGLDSLSPVAKAYDALEQSVQELKRRSTPAASRAATEWTATPVAPAPFFDLPFAWAAPNRQVQQRLFQLLPWTRGGMGSLFATNVAAPDPMWNRAAGQWALWSIQNGVAVPSLQGRYRTLLPDSADTYRKWWPLNMGSRTATVELYKYVDRVQRYESTAPELVWTGTPPLLYPNFAWAYANVDRLLRGFLDLDYSAVLKEAVRVWIDKAAPRENQPTPGKFVNAPLTCDDWIDVQQGNKKGIEQRARIAAANPAIGLNASAATIKKALADIEKGVATTSAVLAAAGVAAPALAEVSAILGTLASSFSAALGPVGIMTAVGTLIAMALIKIVGVAEGYPVDPDSVPHFYVQPNPFLRTIAVRGYYTVAAQGSTGEAFFRTLDAIKNIEIATGIDMGFYAGDWQPRKGLLPEVQFQAALKILPKGATPTPKPITEADCRLFIRTRLALDQVVATPDEVEALVKSCVREVIKGTYPKGSTESSYQLVRFRHRGPEVLVRPSPASAASLVAAGGSSTAAAIWFLL